MDWMLRVWGRINGPVWSLLMHGRRWKKKEHSTRWREKFAFYESASEKMETLWFHASSVGEVLSLLFLLEKLRIHYPDHRFLLTTTTVSSSLLVESRLPKGCVHCFFPVDNERVILRFLDYWNPSAVFFVESELWPVTFLTIKSRNIPLLLINARMSDRSWRRWKFFPWLAESMINRIDRIAARSQEDKDRFSFFSFKKERIILAGDLKWMAPVLPVEERDYHLFRNLLGDRRCFVCASTHPLEEVFLQKIYLAVKAECPDILMIIAPRHPHRAVQIIEDLRQIDPDSLIGQRSLGDLPNASTCYYIADSFGEMGLWYSLATLVFVGGSWINHGGQNMLEPVRLGAACMIGPSNHNFKEVMQRLRAVNGIAEVRNEAEALEWLRRLMTDDLMRLQQKQRGLEAFNDDIDHIVDNYLAIVRHCMDSMESGTKSQ